MYSVLAFYKIVEIDEPTVLVKRWKQFLSPLDVTARVYLSADGVNCQMSIHDDDLPTFMEWLSSDDRFADVDVKVQKHHEHAFPRLVVKHREQLCALDVKVDFTKQATHLTPKQWDAMLEEGDENTVVLDVRNDYEWQVGHFEGTEKPDMETFREFPEYVKTLKKNLDTENTRVMMYCTGGIRCEFFSPLMREAGFEQVYQLEGGVIKYGLEEGQKYWKGNLFVFDDRLVVPISNEKNEMVGTCHTCDALCDTFYNCANMDCNDLFISCFCCAEEAKGCCSEECQEGRCREFVPTKNPKPFRRLSEEK